MAQTIFDTLTAGVSVDNQAALVVQTLLEAQNVQETQPEEDDLFQCGKCKKQFTSLPSFISHKQEQCSPPATLRPVPHQTVVSTSPTAFTTTIQQQQPNRQTVQTLNAVAPSPLTQLTPGMVLSEDIMTFASIDPNLQTQTIQMTFPTPQQATTVQGNPFLSQVGTLNPRGSSANSVTIYSPVTSTTFSANGSAFTSAVPTSQIQMQPHQQTVTLSPMDKSPHTKTSPTKAGRKSAQSLNQQMMTVTEVDASVQQKGKKSKSLYQAADDGLKKRLRCQYCNKMFNKNFDLQQHVRCHTGEKPFQCIVCGRAFAQKSNVKKHMTTHKVWPAGSGCSLPQSVSVLVEDKDSGMTHCNSTMSGEPEETEHNPQPIRELNIGSITDSSGQLNVSVDNSYLCQYCPEKFKTYFLLKSHMVHHKGEQVYKCVLKSCGCTFKGLDLFLEHIKTHEDDMSYRCHMCSEKFQSLYDLGVHQYSHSLYPNQSRTNAPRYFQCTKCLNKYATPEALDHHLSTASHHYPCSTCLKVFTCERYLRRHLATHGSGGQFECKVCYKRFKAENYLKMHSLIHSGEKPFQCEQCKAAFNRKDKLKRHMLIHIPVKKFKCPFKGLTNCEMEFNRPDKLKAHIISHSGVKPYKCGECGKAFCRKPSMLEHERSHRSDFRFRCEKCGKGFFRPKLFHGHKCQPVIDKDGKLIVPAPRGRTKRKIGRPRKRMITVTAETLKSVSTVLTRRRGRPSRRGGDTETRESQPVHPADKQREPEPALSSSASTPTVTTTTTTASSAETVVTVMPTDSVMVSAPQTVLSEPSNAVTMSDNVQQTVNTNSEMTTQQEDSHVNAEGKGRDMAVEVAFTGMEFARTDTTQHLTTSNSYVVQLQACDLGKDIQVQDPSVSATVTMTTPSIMSPEVSHQLKSVISSGAKQILQPSVIGQVELVDLSNARVVSASDANGVEIEIANLSDVEQVNLVSQDQQMAVADHLASDVSVSDPSVHAYIVESPASGVERVMMRRQVLFTAPGTNPGEMVTCVAEIEADAMDTGQAQIEGRRIQHYVTDTDPVLQGTESLLKASEEILRSAEDQ